MGVGRRFRKKPVRRPTKTGCARRRRDKLQAKRLVGMGMGEKDVSRLTTKDVRSLLRRPNKTVALVASRRK